MKPRNIPDPVPPRVHLQAKCRQMQCMQLLGFLANLNLMQIAIGLSRLACFLTVCSLVSLLAVDGGRFRDD